MNAPTAFDLVVLGAGPAGVQAAIVGALFGKSVALIERGTKIGGVIGSEYACTSAALGAEVHLVDGRDVLLPFLDAELSRALAEAMTASGIHFHGNERVLACTASPIGDLTLELSSGARLAVDSVFVAAGRRSNVKGLALDKAGLVAGERGLLRVDEAFRTSLPHIHAVGGRHRLSRARVDRHGAGATRRVRRVRHALQARDLGALAERHLHHS